jgi:predicted nucleic acid-binding protein
VILCPNTSPLLVLAKLDRLDLLGDLDGVVLTTAVLSEVRDNSDIAAARVDAVVGAVRSVADPPIPPNVDPSRNLGAGERSVLAWTLGAGVAAVSVLDDAAARVEARRLQLSFTGTLGLILRARRDGRVTAAAPLLREAVAAGLYLADPVLSAALATVGEVWHRPA